MTAPTEQKKLTQQQAIAVERDLAKFANTMDSVVRIPFRNISANSFNTKSPQSCP